MSAELVERVARVLEPQAWAALGTGDTLAYRNRRTSSLRKATAAIEAMGIDGLLAERERLTRECGELRTERDALLQKPINLAKLDSIDEEVTDRMIAYYWWHQAQDARAALAQPPASSSEKE